MNKASLPPPERRAANRLVKPAALAAFAVFLGVVLGRWSAPAANAPDSPHSATASVPLPRPVGFAEELVPRDAASLEARWRASRARAPSQASDERLIADLEALAAEDPARALALATAETKLRLRWELFRALLRGWARRDPAAAIAWAREQRQLDRSVAVDAVLAGVIDRPTEALRLTRELSAAEPESALFYGNALLSLLARHGHFTMAAEFARTAPDSIRSDWLGMAYQLWASHRPAEAWQEVQTHRDAADRALLAKPALEGWAQADPANLAQYAITSLQGADRTLALTESLRGWAVIDVLAAAEWVGRLEPGSDVDAALATLAVTPQLLRTPEIAVEWAGSISDPQRRSVVVGDVMREWFSTDPRAARQHAEALTSLPAEEKRRLIESLSGG